MPLYQYACVRCERPCEAFMPMTRAAEPTGCPDCGGLAERVFVAPSVISDATIYNLQDTSGNQFRSEAMRDFYMTKAQAAGINTTGKMYDAQLARFPGDPQAWVGSDGDIRQVLKKRGWGSKGRINETTVESDAERAPTGGLAAKHVKSLVADRLKREPGQKLSKVVEDVVNDHAPRGAKRIVKAKKAVKR